jgi:hypothetical protein
MRSKRLGTSLTLSRTGERTDTKVVKNNCDRYLNKVIFVCITIKLFLTYGNVQQKGP